MDRLFQLRRNELRYAALVNIEKRQGLAVKYALLAISLLVIGFAPQDPAKQIFFYVYLGILISGTLVYSFLYKRLLPIHRVAVMIFGVCLEVSCISFIYYALVRGRMVPIVFLFLSLPVLRLILFYPGVLEFLLAVGSSSAVFLFVTAILELQQLALLSFWIYFASAWLILGLGAVITSKLLTQFNRSVKNRQLILQALQMVSSLVEMAQSTAYLHEKRKIFQKSVEIISRVMAAGSCVAWTCQDKRLYPVASEGLDEEQASRFREMELFIHDIPVFERALTQKMPIVVIEGDLEEMVPSFYRRCFDVEAMFVIPLTDDKQTLGCVSLHWRTTPEKITSQELAILSGIATQIGITLENVYLLEELREKEEIRGRLLERVISIQEEERERIARELHDETGQILTALMVNVELLRTDLGSPSTRKKEFLGSPSARKKKKDPYLPYDAIAKAQKRLEEMSSLLSKTMDDIHSLSLDLHPKILNELGLVPAIRWYAKNHLERWGIDFNISADNLNHSLSAKHEICLFRVAQEAITNVIRHAQARRVDIEIGVDAESVYLGIRDDGVGFDIDPRFCSLAIASSGNGSLTDPRARGESNGNGESRLGLRSMEERVSFLGGQLCITSEVGKGTEVSVNIPLQIQDEEEVF